MTEPTIMSLAQVREVLQSYWKSENDTDAVFAAKEIPDLCATVEKLYGVLKEAVDAETHTGNCFGGVDECCFCTALEKGASIIAQLERKEASIPILPKEIPSDTGCAGIDIIVSKRVDPSPISDDSHRCKEYKP